MGEAQAGSRGRVARTLLATTAILALAVGAAGAYGYMSFTRAQKAVGSFTISPEPSAAAEERFGPCVRNVCNYLILGSDSRAGLPPGQQEQFGSNRDIGGSNRSDVIMIVHTDPGLAKNVILSFPRDLWVRIPGHGEGKINSAFEGGLNGGGPQLVARTVESVTGLHVNHVLYVDLLGFEGVVKALGGVDMCIPSNLVNTPDGRIVDDLTALNIAPGCQRLDALQALAYVRTRHLPCDTIPDFSRIGRQQAFLRAVMNRLLQPSEISKAPSLIRPVAQNLVTDPGFKLADIIYLADQLQGLGDPAADARADFRTVPGRTATVSVPQSSVPLSVVKMDPSAQALFRALRESTPLPARVGVTLPQTPPSPANISTLVVDDRSEGTAAKVESTLSLSGFDVTPGLTTAGASGISPGGSAIVYGDGEKEDAEVLAQYLPGLTPLPARGNMLPRGVSAAVVISSGYRLQPVGAGPGAPAAGQCVAPSG